MSKFLYFISLSSMVFVFGCSPSSNNDSNSKGKEVKQTLLCDYKMDSLLGGQSSGVLMFTLKKIGDEIIEVNSQDYSFKKEKQVVRYDVDKKDGTKYPAYSKLELDNGKINLLLEVTIDKYTHRTTIDKTGNYYQSAGLAALSGTCREGKPLY